MQIQPCSSPWSSSSARSSASSRSSRVAEAASDPITGPYHLPTTRRRCPGCDPKPWALALSWGSVSRAGGCLLVTLAATVPPAGDKLVLVARYLRPSLWHCPPGGHWLSGSIDALALRQGTDGTGRIGGSSATYRLVRAGDGSTASNSSSHQEPAPCQRTSHLERSISPQRLKKMW